jgi:hypothetical protein
LIYAAIHILTWTLIRYRLPIDAVTTIFAALIFVHIAGFVLNKRGNQQTTSSSNIT